MMIKNWLCLDHIVYSLLKKCYVKDAVNIFIPFKNWNDQKL